MTTVRLILGDQLSHSMSSLRDCQQTSDVILMCEVWNEATYVKHHKKKIAFIFSAMRHFASELSQRGYHVEYTKLNDPKNSGSFSGEIKRILDRYDIERIIVTHPGEYRVLHEIQKWSSDFGVHVDIRTDDRFLCSPVEFSEWAQQRKQLRMEYFYREMRVKYDILMQNGQPVGGQWNYDIDNRKPPKHTCDVPPPFCAQIDDVTRDVMQLVAEQFADHFGSLDPFYFAVDRDGALQALKMFIAQRLSLFGDYQDAMIQNEPWMFHSHLSFYLNCGLLLPLECVAAAEVAYSQGQAPLNAVEGFIRQIIGWREYIRGVYWLRGPTYIQENYFNATRNLPAFYWTAETRMNCLRQCVLATERYSYAHHIQRLMVLGNFTLLAGIDPRQVNEWFLIVYADAYEWVELPNVSGMILFADGGFLASKPYAAGGSYINKMSDYCTKCSYKVAQKNGPDACPFNYLYWDFLTRHREKLKVNHRIGMLYKVFDRMSDDKKHAQNSDSQYFLQNLS